MGHEQSQLKGHAGGVTVEHGCPYNKLIAHDCSGQMPDGNRMAGKTQNAGKTGYSEVIYAPAA